MAEFVRRCKLKGCGKDFVTRRPQQRFCSQAHAIKFNNRKVKGRVERRNRIIEKLKSGRLPIEASNRVLWAQVLARELAPIYGASPDDAEKTVTAALLIRKKLGWDKWLTKCDIAYRA